MNKHLWDNRQKFVMSGSSYEAILMDDGTIMSLHLYDGLNVWPNMSASDRKRAQSHVDKKLKQG